MATLLPGPTALAGWLVALVAGAIAAWALHGLAIAQGLTSGAAQRAVLLLAVAPFTVFTVAVYSEALWLAAAVIAWWAGRQNRWGWVALAASVATATRVTGLFLVAGLLVMYAVGAPSRARAKGWWRATAGASWVVVPAVPVGVFMAYLRSETGSWMAWREAQVVGWKRASMTPWEGLWQQWQHLVSAPNGWLVTARVLDLLAVLVGLVLTAVLLRRRHWWPEATYVGLSVLAIMSTSLWDSTGRYALTWFPAYLVLARWLDGRPRWLAVAAFTLSAAGAVLILVWFATRHWIG